MNTVGIIIGLVSFTIIGVFHPIVIKSKYHLGKRVWPVFLIWGFALCAVSLFSHNTVASVFLAVTVHMFLEH